MCALQAVCIFLTCCSQSCWGGVEHDGLQQVVTLQGCSLAPLDGQTRGRDDKLVELTQNLTATHQQLKDAQVGSLP